MFSRFNFPWRRQSRRTFNIHLLDGNTLYCELESRASGEDLLSRVLQEVRVQEGEYFGLMSINSGYAKWIQARKPLRKQLSGRPPHTLYFRVRIYPRDHHIIISHNTRHQLFLQVRHDLKESRLKCSESALSQLAALTIQADVGDFDPVSCGANYVSEIFAIPRVGGQLEEAIVQLHRLNRGKPPGVCEEEFLELAQDLTTYGFMGYKVQDPQKNQVTLSTGPVGVTVLQGGLDTTNVEWDCILRIVTKGKRISLHISTTHTMAAYQRTFTCASSDMATNLCTLLNHLQQFYSTTDFERPRSALKRFFSSRRSLRRRNPPPRASFIHPASNPIQRRASRRSSYSGGVATPSQRFQDLAISIDYASPAHQPPSSSDANPTTNTPTSVHTPSDERDCQPSSPPNCQSVTVELNAGLPDTDTGQYIDQPAPFHIRSHSNPDDSLYAIKHDNPSSNPHSTSPPHPAPPDHTSPTPPIPPHALPHPFPCTSTSDHNHHHGNGSRRLSNDHSPPRRARHERAEHSPQAQVGSMPPLEESTRRVKRKSCSLPRESSISPPRHPTTDGLGHPTFLGPAVGRGSKMDKWKAYAAKPRNRPRLSLQDSKYYDARGLKRSMHRMETFGGQTGHFQSSLEGSYLGSITSLEYQTNFAELSQTEDTIDPHLRSFVFESSQTEGTGTEL